MTIADAPRPRRAPSPIACFLLVGAVLGALFALLQPALTGYDEPLHLLRAWEIADGHVTGTRVSPPHGDREVGGRFDGALVDEVRRLLCKGYYGHAKGRTIETACLRIVAAHPSRPRTFVDLVSAEVYSPLPYAPASAAIASGRAVGLSTLATVRLARLAMLAAYLALAARSIHHLDDRRWLLAVLALTPVCLFQAAMISADGVTLGIVLLAVALAVRLARAETLTTPIVAEGAAVLVALALAKPPYFLFVALFVPALVRHRHTVAGRVLTATLVPAVVLNALWTRYAQSLYVPQSSPLVPAKGGYAYVDVHPSAQLHFAATHPWALLAAIGRTVAHAPGQLIHDVAAQSPQVPTPWGTPLVVACAAYAAIVLAMRAVSVSETSAPTRLELALDLGVAAVVTLAVFMLAYAGWNQLRAPRIDAFQGRYLFPVVALSAVVTAPALARKAATPATRIIVAALALVSVSSLVTLIGLVRHYS